MSIGVGDRAPDFTLPGTGGTDVSLRDFAGHPVVLVFYPGDDTPVCTKQLNTYNDGLEQFTELGAQVLAISAQDVRSVRIPRATHLSNLDQPDAFSDAIRRFVAGLPAD